MKRAKKGMYDRISAIIPKNHFVSMSFFREQPLINWTYTKAVLFTAYDIHRSSDFWVDEIVSSGQTLKEALVDLGFPEENTLMADTGIFEIEAKKAGISRDLGIDVQINLSNDQIFEAYELSGADIFVSPDEIILAADSDATAEEKLHKIQDNMLQALEHFPAKQMIGVLQGIEQTRVEDLFDFYRSHGIEMFAIGGVIPLYRHDKSLFKQVLRNTRELTKDFWLHTFGLPRINLLPFYLQEVGMDSVDTSMLLYLTARRRYLVNTDSRPVRLANFETCNCPGCTNLIDSTYSMSIDFFINLYIHNLLEASKIAKLCSKGEWTPQPREQQTEPAAEPDEIRHIDPYEPIRDYDGQWVTSDILLDDLNKEGEDSPSSVEE